MSKNFLPKMTENTKSDKSTQEKVAEWLSNEGYPLEFSTANVFRKNGFQVHQGYYVQDVQSETPREVDVLAQMTIHLEKSFLRTCYIVECKWSGDKPWVVFTSPQHHIAPSACVTQTIGSETGETILWSLAGDKLIQSLDTFNTPDCPGFNGRQVFSKGNDTFYCAMQSVASSANSLAKDYNRGNRTLQATLHLAIVIFPVIVIEGLLFTASYNEQTKKIDLENSEHVRIHWRGAETSKFPFTTIDLVTVSHLEEFVSKRRIETKTLLHHMKTSLEQLQECVRVKSLEPLSVISGGRGITGLPPLLVKIRALSKETKSGKLPEPPDES